MKTILITIMLSMLFVSTGMAHDLWIAKDTSMYIVARGHAPDRIDDYDPDCVKEVRGFDTQGSPVPLDMKSGPSRMTFKADKALSVITVRCDWGYRVITTEGKKLMSREEAEKAGLRVIDAFFSTQFLKTIIAESILVTKPLGIGLELIPLKNPFRLAPKEALPVQAFFQGKALAGVDVRSHTGKTQKADSNGIAYITILPDRHELISTRHMVRSNDTSEIDYRLFTTFLAIGVPE